MAAKSRAIVQTGARKLEMREFPLPEIRDDDGLLRVEACGICGSDYEQYQGAFPGLRFRARRECDPYHAEDVKLRRRGNYAKAMCRPCCCASQ